MSILGPHLPDGALTHETARRQLQARLPKSILRLGTPAAAVLTARDAVGAASAAAAVVNSIAM
jgi:hypothetical protein